MARLSIAVATLLAGLRAVSGLGYASYTATLTTLDGSGTFAGGVAVFVSSTGLMGAGKVIGLEPNLANAANNGTDCTATNGCGAHVHAGTACTDAATQGGHYMVGSTDPWATIGYSSTDAAGMAFFMFAFPTGATSIAGKPFIIHNDAGGRVACGILQEDTEKLYASLAQLSSSGVAGSVTVATLPSRGLVFGAGSAENLEVNLTSVANGGTDCTATNGCGVHVHGGTACTDTATQGGHYYGGSTDPWATIRYGSTDADGATSFVFASDIGISPPIVMGKPFVVHNNAGGRVGCGLLAEALTTTMTTTGDVVIGGAYGGSRLTGASVTIAFALASTHLRAQ